MHKPRPVTTRHANIKSLSSDGPVIPPDFELFRTQDIRSSGKAGGGDAHSKPYVIKGKSVRYTGGLPDKPTFAGPTPQVKP